MMSASDDGPPDGHETNGAPERVQQEDGYGTAQEETRVNGVAQGET